MLAIQCAAGLSDPAVSAIVQNGSPAVYVRLFASFIRFVLIETDGCDEAPVRVRVWPSSASATTHPTAAWPHPTTHPTATGTNTTADTARSQPARTAQLVIWQRRRHRHSRCVSATELRAFWSHTAASSVACSCTSSLAPCTSRLGVTGTPHMR